MDFHPLVIHYPIAFLTTYAVFEILRFKQSKEIILYVGEISAIATLIITMFFSESMNLEGRLVDMYKLFMFSTVLIFGLSSIFYLKKSNSFLIIPLAIVGLLSIVIAGGLFGATVYGTHYDPYLAPIFKLLGVY